MNVNHASRIGTAGDPFAKVNGDKDATHHQQALEVAQQFEEIFVTMMVQSFRKAQLSDEGGLFGSSVGSNTYEQWFDQHMSSHLAKNSSIGIADTLIRDFRRLGALPKEEHGTRTMQTTGVNHVA
jgi:Rod binding domain-containing protein